MNFFLLQEVLSWVFPNWKVINYKAVLILLTYPVKYLKSILAEDVGNILVKQNKFIKSKSTSVVKRKWETLGEEANDYNNLMVITQGFQWNIRLTHRPSE